LPRPEKRLLGHVLGLVGVTEKEARESVGPVELAPGEAQETLLGPRNRRIGQESPSHVTDVWHTVKSCIALIQTNDRSIRFSPRRGAQPHGHDRVPPNPYRERPPAASRHTG
jgi:hypothetical protein